MKDNLKMICSLTMAQWNMAIKNSIKVIGLEVHIKEKGITKIRIKYIEVNS